MNQIGVDAAEKKNFFTARELAGIELPGVPSTESAILRKAKKERWQSRKREGKGGGREYGIESLPAEARMAIIEKRTDMSKPDPGGAPVKKNDERKATYVDLKPWQREEADKRMALAREWLKIRADVPGRKLTEVKRRFAKSHNIGHKSLDRYVTGYQSGGYPALVPAWRNGEKQPVINREMAAFIENAYLQPLGPPVRKVHGDLRKAFDGKYRCPSYRTVADYIDRKWTDAQQLLVRNKQEWDRLYSPYIRRDWDECSLNEVWVGDSKQMDVCCLYRGKAVFPWLVAILEAKSRKFVGWILVATPNALVIGQAVIYAISQCGPCKTFYIDLGRDYRAHHVAGVLVELGIETFFAAPYNAREKLIESNFGWFTDRMKDWPGYRGHSIKTRPKKLHHEIKSGKLLTFEEISKKVDELIIERNSLPHCTTGRPPVSFWENHQAVIPSQHLLDFLLMDVNAATVRDSSVAIKGLLYRDDNLFKLSGERVEVRRDPRDITRAAIIYKGAVFCAAKLETPSHYRSEITLQSVKDAARIRRKIKNFRKQIIEAEDVIDDPLLLAMQIEDQEKVRQRDIQPADSNVKQFHKKEKLARDSAKALEADKAEENTANATSRPDILDRYLRASSMAMGSVRTLQYNDDPEDF